MNSDSICPKNVYYLRYLALHGYTTPELASIFSHEFKYTNGRLEQIYDTENGSETASPRIVSERTFQNLIHTKVVSTTAFSLYIECIGKAGDEAAGAQLFWKDIPSSDKNEILSIYPHCEFQRRVYSGGTFFCWWTHKDFPYANQDPWPSSTFPKVLICVWLYLYKKALSEPEIISIGGNKVCANDKCA